MASNSPDPTSIPHEVLSHIFALLHIEDRKSVRRVCRVWNECCNCPAIVKNETFCFRAGSPIESIDSFLQECSQFPATIAFRGLTLNQLPSESTWHMIGEKIHSLSLAECTVSDETIRNIILYCENMHSFEFSSQFKGRSTYYDRFCSQKTLDELIQMNVERRKVTLFHLNIDAEMGADNLEKIFKIFPCIRNFGAGHALSPWHTFYDGTLYGTFNPALIKELSFNVLSNGAWLQEMVNNNKIKLQKLEMILRTPPDPMTVFRQFLRNQSHLRIIKIEFWNCYRNGGDGMLLLEILENCPNLVDFRYRSLGSCNRRECSEVLQKISTSKLECVMISLHPGTYSATDAFDDNLFKSLTNKTIHTLRLDMLRNLPDECVCQILKNFVSLRHIYIGFPTNKILQTIFQYHIHLKTLVLHGLNNCTEVGFHSLSLDLPAPNGTAYSISRLRELVHLEIKGARSAEELEAIIQKFDFPRLKYLCLSSWGVYREVNLEHLPTGTPSLEELSTYGLSLGMDQLEYLCTNLQRLGSLSFNNRFNLSIPLDVERTKTLADLFIMRPSLKCIIEYHADGRYYLYDRFTKTNNVLQMDNFKHIHFTETIFCCFK